MALKGRLATPLDNDNRGTYWGKSTRGLLTGHGGHISRRIKRIKRRKLKEAFLEDRRDDGRQCQQPIRNDFL